jgi:hypothetical protein
MKKASIAILSIVLIAGCAAPMTKSASQVRQIQYGQTEGCKFLGVVESEGGMIYASKIEGKRDMLNKIRAETAKIGGNAFSITAIEIRLGFSRPFTQADAYRCSEHKA